MKILFILENTIKDLRGGTEVSSRHVAGLLRKHGVEIEEWSPFNVRKPIFWYTSAFGQLYILIVLLCKLVKTRVQILHVQGKYLIPPAVLIGKLFKIPTIVTIRDYIVVCPIGLCLFDFKKGVSLLNSLLKQGDSLIYAKHGFSFFFFHEISSFLSTYHKSDHLMIRIIRYFFLIRGWFVTEWLRFWLRRADAVVSVSKYVQRVLDASGVKSEVIFNTFDPAFASKSNKVQPCRGKVEPLNTVLFVGKPSYGKGYDLFRSLSRNKLFEKYRFVTIGGDNKLPYLETLRKIKEAVAVVVPSRWPEPFGRVALEALMMGTPTVVTKSGGLTEIIEDGVTGVLSEISVESLAEGLKRVIDNNSRLGRNIRRLREQLIEKFSKIPVRQHLRLYSSLIS